jgi:hypothetical protein
MSAKEEKQDGQVVVDDPDAFARTRQLKAVFDARDQFLRVRKEVAWGVNNRSMTRSTAAKMVQTSLQELIMALEPLLLDAGDYRELLEEREYMIHDAELLERVPSLTEAISVAQREVNNRFGDYRGLTDSQGNIQPEHMTQSQQREIRMIAAEKMGRFSGVTLTGIRTFGARDIELAVRAGSSWVKQAPPVETSVEVFSDCQEAMSELGLGFEIAEEEQQSRVTDELLREVEGWRKQHDI